MASSQNNLVSPYVDQINHDDLTDTENLPTVGRKNMEPEKKSNFMQAPHHKMHCENNNYKAQHMLEYNKFTTALQYYFQGQVGLFI